MENANWTNKDRQRALLVDGLKPYWQLMTQELQKLDAELDRKTEDLRKAYDELKADVRAAYRGGLVDFMEHALIDSKESEVGNMDSTTESNGFQPRSPAAISRDVEASDAQNQIHSLSNGSPSAIPRQPRHGGVAPTAYMLRGPPLSTQKRASCTDNIHARSGSVSIMEEHYESLSGPITKARSRHIRRSLGDMKHHTCGKPFATAVDSTFYPTYYDIVQHPMDLQLMTERLNEGMYATVEAFLDDLDRIVKAALEYNGEGSEMAGAANEMSAIFKEKLKAMPGVEVEDKIPSRKKRKTAADVDREVHEAVDCPDDMEDTDYRH